MALTSANAAVEELTSFDAITAASKSKTTPSTLLSSIFGKVKEALGTESSAEMRNEEPTAQKPAQITTAIVANAVKTTPTQKPLAESEKEIPDEDILGFVGYKPKRSEAASQQSSAPGRKPKKLKPKEMPMLISQDFDTSFLDDLYMSRSADPQSPKTETRRSSFGLSSKPGGFSIDLKPMQLVKKMRIFTDDEIRKDYWMRDEISKECFQCKLAFTTFRRRHHCRICGQVFCAKCSQILPGERFNMKKDIRVCEYCSKRMRDYSVDPYAGAINAASTTSYMGWGGEEVIEYTLPQSLQQWARNYAPTNANSTVSSIAPSNPARSATQNNSFDNFRRLFSSSSLVNRWFSSSAQSNSSETPKELNPTALPFRNADATDDEETDDGFDIVEPFEEERLAHYLSGYNKNSVQTMPPLPSADSSEVAEQNNMTWSNIRMYRRRNTQQNIVPSVSRRFLKAEAAQSAPVSPVHPFQNKTAAHTHVKDDSIMTIFAQEKREDSELIQLSSNSLDFLRTFLKQLLKEYEISHKQKEWEDAIMNVVTKVCLNVRPDPRQHGEEDIDIRKFVKIKKHPGFDLEPSIDYINGWVITKNVMHKKMLEPKENPRILLISFALEFDRQEDRFMSLELILKQEHEYLQNIVKRIQDLQPDIVIVEKSVSRVALNLLLDAGIIVVNNMNASTMEHLSRVTNAELCLTLDRITLRSDARLGTCERFSVKRVGDNKSFMFFDGCLKNKGCTLLLKGSDLMTLEKIKRVVDFMVLVTYNLMLETSLIGQGLLPSSLQELEGVSSDDGGLFRRFLLPYTQIQLSISPNVRFPPPYLLRRMVEKEAELKNDQATTKLLKNAFHKFLRSLDDISSYYPNKMLPVEFKQGLNYLIENSNIILSPFNHQQLTILYCNINSNTQIPCHPPDIHIINYYKTWDMTLGQYLEELCFDSEYLCNSCQLNMLLHYRSYVHNERRLNVRIERCEEQENDAIMMYFECTECGHSSAPLRMSDNTWKYSFGKYLEALFYLSDNHVDENQECLHPFQSRVNFFVLMNKYRVSFQLEKIKLFLLERPPLKISYDLAVIGEMKQKDFQDLLSAIKSFFLSIEERLKIVEDLLKTTLSKLHDKLLKQKLQLMKKLKTIYIETGSNDLLPMNAVRVLLFDIGLEWDKIFMDLLKTNIQLTDLLNKRNSTQQLKKLFHQEPLTSAHVELDEYELFPNFVSNSAESTVVNISLNHQAPSLEPLKLSELVMESPDCEEEFLSPGSPTLMGDEQPVDLVDLDQEIRQTESQLLRSDPMLVRQASLNPTSSRDETSLDLFLTEENHEESSGEYAEAFEFPVLEKETFASEPMISILSEDKSSVETLESASILTTISNNTAALPSQPPSLVGERLSLIRTLKDLWTQTGTWNVQANYPISLLGGESAVLNEILGLRPLDYSFLTTDHVINDCDIIIRENEPTSIIAFALTSKHYVDQIKQMRQNNKAHALEETHPREDLNGRELGLKHTLRSSAGTHIRYEFKVGSVQCFCRVYFAEQFDAVREATCANDHFIQSLSRCQDWKTLGGQSGSHFFKTRDDRFIMKQLSKAEMEAFVGFATEYFKHLSEVFFHDLPSVMVKLLGVYRIGFKREEGNQVKQMKIDVVVMENLFYQKKKLKIFDLKGSIRNRHVQSTGNENEVLLDQNLLEIMGDSPLFIREHDKRSLRASVWNDTLFLSRLNVMDYSLLVGVGEGELVVGIVDFIRTFTWDKKLESWVKETGILGGGKEPIIVSPRLYKNRFREAMEKYFLMVPGKFNQPPPLRRESEQE